MGKRILILGGYGNAGRLIAELLIKETGVSLIIAGRNLKKAETLAQKLNNNFNTHRVSAMTVDAANLHSLKNAFSKTDLVLVASSTMELVAYVARAAIESKIDYFDIQLSMPAKLETLQSLQEEIKRTGCCFITDGGFHPGVPAALMRYAGDYLDQMEKAIVGSLMKFNWEAYSFSETARAELVEEFRLYRPLVYQDGNWKNLKWSEFRKLDFGEELGKKYCAPMMLQELYSLPHMYPSLKEIGYFVAGFNWFVDYFILPIVMLALKISPHKSVKPVGKLLEWGLKTFTAPPFITVLKLEAQGRKNNQRAELEISLSHQDAYFFTAAPVVACLIQYLHDDIRKPGLWLQANMVKPKRFLGDMKKLGIEVTIETKFN